jgi:hypothetical protein
MHLVANAVSALHFLQDRVGQEIGERLKSSVPGSSFGPGVIRTLITQGPGEVGMRALARSGVIAACCFIFFIGVIRELSASIILFTPATEGDVGGHLRPEGREGQFGAIAVLGLVMLVMTFATDALVQRVLDRDFLGAREQSPPFRPGIARVLW